MTLSHVRRSALLSIVAVLMSGCDLSVGPGQFVPRELALDFCSNDTPVWLAYRNEQTDWTRVLPDASGTFRFTADYRVALAWVHQSGSDYHTQIIGATNVQLDQISGSNCLEDAGTKQLNGTVTGISGTQKAQVSMMFASPYLQLPQTSFSLQNLPDRSLDLVASRVNLTDNTLQSSDKIIIRRDQSFVAGATMPVLDFGSSEAFNPGFNTVTVGGVSSAETTGMGNNFFTSQGTTHVLFFATITANGDFSVPSVPPLQTQAGDYNDLFLFANSADGRSRGVETFYRTSNDKTIAAGAHLTPVPEFTVVSTTPYLRHRARLDITADYQNAVSFFFHQQFAQISVTDVTMTVTQAYYTATTARWDLIVPDFSAVEGWQNEWGLQDGTSFTWRATVYRGRGALLFGAAPEENEAILFAARTSSPAPPALVALTAPSAQIIAPRRRPSSLYP